MTLDEAERLRDQIKRDLNCQAAAVPDDTAYTVSVTINQNFETPAQWDAWWANHSRRAIAHWRLTIDTLMPYGLNPPATNAPWVQTAISPWLHPADFNRLYAHVLRNRRLLSFGLDFGRQTLRAERGSYGHQSKFAALADGGHEAADRFAANWNTMVSETLLAVDAFVGTFPRELYSEIHGTAFEHQRGRRWQAKVARFLQAMSPVDAVTSQATIADDGEVSL